MNVKNDNPEVPQVQFGNQVTVASMTDIAQMLDGLAVSDPLGYLEMGGDSLRPPSRTGGGGSCSSCGGECSEYRYVNILVAVPCCSKNDVTDDNCGESKAITNPSGTTGRHAPPSMSDSNYCDGPVGEPVHSTDSTSSHFILRNRVKIDSQGNHTSYWDVSPTLPTSSTEEPGTNVEDECVPPAAQQACPAPSGPPKCQRPAYATDDSYSLSSSPTTAHPPSTEPDNAVPSISNISLVCSGQWSGRYDPRVNSEARVPVRGSTAASTLDSYESGSECPSNESQSTPAPDKTPVVRNENSSSPVSSPSGPSAEYRRVQQSSVVPPIPTNFITESGSPVSHLITGFCGSKQQPPPISSQTTFTVSHSGAPGTPPSQITFTVSQPMSPASPPHVTCTYNVSEPRAPCTPQAQGALNVAQPVVPSWNLPSPYGDLTNTNASIRLASPHATFDFVSPEGVRHFQQQSPPAASQAQGTSNMAQPQAPSPPQAQGTLHVSQSRAPFAPPAHGTFSVAQPKISNCIFVPTSPCRNNNVSMGRSSPPSNSFGSPGHPPESIRQPQQQPQVSAQPQGMWNMSQARASCPPQSQGTFNVAQPIIPNWMHFIPTSSYIVPNNTCNSFSTSPLCNAPVTVTGAHYRPSTDGYFSSGEGGHPVPDQEYSY